jgi:hypothetical protein
MFKKLFGKPTPKPILEPPPDVFKITQIYTGYSEAQQAFNRLKPSHYGIDVDTSNFQLHIPGWGRGGNMPNQSIVVNRKTITTRTYSFYQNKSKPHIISEISHELIDRNVKFIFEVEIVNPKKIKVKTSNLNFNLKHLPEWSLTDRKNIDGSHNMKIAIFTFKIGNTSNSKFLNQKMNELTNLVKSMKSIFKNYLNIRIWEILLHNFVLVFCNLVNFALLFL